MDPKRLASTWIGPFGAASTKVGKSASVYSCGVGEWMSGFTRIAKGATRPSWVATRSSRSSSPRLSTLNE